MNDPLSLLSHTETSPHLILYGDVSMIPSQLWERLHGSPISLQESQYEMFSFRYHTDYYEIETPTITQSICACFVKWFTHMFVKGGFYRRKTAFIVWKSFDSARPLVQDVLRVLLETSRQVTCIFLTNNYTAITPPLQSRCVSVRIPSTSTRDTTYISPCHKIATQILDIYSREESLLSSHHSSLLKSHAMTILKYDLNIPELFRYLIEGITYDARYPHVVKYNVVDYLTTQEHKYKQGYMKLVWMEGILVTLDYLLFTAHYKVDGQKKEQIDVLLDKGRPDHHNKQEEPNVDI